MMVLAVVAAQAQINTPAPSPAGSVSTTVGLTDITVDYFRPGVKGRMIFGEGDSFLQPYGQLWRSGANSGTTVTFSTDVNVAGSDIEAGTYMILSTPGKDNWEFILYSDPSVGGNMSRVEDDKKVLTASVKNMNMGNVESLSFWISDISADNTSANLNFAWADHGYQVPIVVDYDEIVMADIAKATKVNPGNYMQAANYYLNNGKDLTQALEWANTYLAIEGNENQFWNTHTKAKIQAALGMKKEAIATATASMEKAKANEGGAFGYDKRNADLIAELKGK